jgi:ubiquinone/menaquinone biosynthesis C-methylase UbiE
LLIFRSSYMPSTPMLTVLDEDRHWWFATRTRAILAYLDRYVGPGQGRRVLDVGCGAANMTHHLRHYGDVIGVDSNPKPLEIARERGLEAYQGSADDLPFEDSTFDLVTLLDTVEHVPAEDTVFEECRRVLRGPDAAGGRAGGRLLVTVPAFMFLWSQNDVINMHQRRYTVPELTAKLERHGFRLLRISYNNFFVFPLAAGIILLRRGRAEPKLASPHFDEDAYQVEMEPASPVVNTVLTEIGKLEVALLRRVDLPWGTSIIAIAEKL